MDDLQRETGKLVRKKLEFKHDVLALKVSSEENQEGSFGEVAALRQKLRVEAAVFDSKLNQLQHRRTHAEKLVADGALRAKIGGVVRHRSRGLVVGDTPPGVAVFVVRDEDIGFTFDLPVPWRNMLNFGSGKDSAARVYIDVPQLVCSARPPTSNRSRFCLSPPYSGGAIAAR